MNTRLLALIVTGFCSISCSRGETAEGEPTNISDGSFSLLGTSWTYPGDNGETILETIDGKGNYVSTSGTKVTDRGTVRMVDGQACFDSARSDAPPNCWHVPEVAVGETKEYVDNHGQRLRVTRVSHVDR